MLPLLAVCSQLHGPEAQAAMRLVEMPGGRSRVRVGGRVLHARARVHPGFYAAQDQRRVEQSPTTADGPEGMDIVGSDRRCMLDAARARTEMMAP